MQNHHADDRHLMVAPLDREAIGERMRVLKANQIALLRKDGRQPYAGPARAKWDEYGSRFEDLMYFWSAADRDFQRSKSAAT